ncbi:MAG: PPC domain-containing DNA-binding protein [Candidatus Thorarchaeota archaeon]
MFINADVQNPYMVRSIQTEAKRVIISRMEPGEDVLETIEAVAAEHGVKSGHITLIGAISGAKLGYFHLAANEYRDFTVDEDVEVVSCMGNISTLNGKPMVHAHMIVSDETGKCYGGHLMKGCKVSVTIELVMTVTATDLTRARDDRTGLNLLDIS